ENASAASGLRRGQAPNYRALVASRVSLSIRTVRPDDTPLPQRPGKLPWYDAALPIVALSDSALPDDAPSDARTFPNDGSVGHGLYRSANEELDDVVWAVKTAHLSERRSWNDLAILAHDNATVRAFGERLREDGVPVRYSSVTRPLKDEPFVRGLFSLIELAQLRNRGMANVNNEKLASLSSFVRLRVSALMDSPLVTVGAHGAGEPARLSVVEAAMRSLASLVSVIDGVGDGRERGWHADDVDHANYGEYADYADHGHDGNHSDHVDRVDRAKYVDDANDANDVDDAGRVDQAERAGSGQSEAPGESVESDGSAATAGSANPSEPSESFGSSEPSDGGDLRAVMEAWKGWRDAHMTSAMDSTVNQTDDGPTMVVDDTLVARDAEHVDPQHLNPQHLDQAGLNQAGLNAQGLDAQRLDPQGGATRTFASANGSTGNTHGGPAFGIDALYLLLACDGYAGVDAAGICSSITTVTGNSLHARAFEQLWRMVDAVARGLATLRRPETQYALSLAWQACNVADRWQRTALDNTADGRAANDRLDAAMRLFEYAQGSGAGRDIDGFLDQVRSMRIEADSLAKVAPIDDAVTLTTPAGADGDHWPLVWIVGVQQGVWPNLAERNTMFGGEDLARIMLADNAQAHRDRGPEPNIVEDATSPDRLRDDAFASVLASEQRSFLVALTRASERLSVSAVSSDDMTPSDFLYGYLPEYFDRDLDAAGTPVYTEAGGDTRSGGMDADPRGLAALARARIMRHCSDVVDAFGAADVVGVANTVNASGVDEPTDVADSADATAAAAVDDAARALAVLAEQGVSSADPSNWAYLHNAENAENAQNAENNGITRNTENVENIQDAEDAENAQNTGNAEDAEDADGPAIAAVHDSPASSSGPMVSLSPSAVDGLWGCPVCWLLENQFAGPGTGSVAQSFGTLIHLIAQLASAEGLDRPEHTAGTPVDERTAAVTARMMELYRQQRPVADDDLEAQERYDAMDKDKKAQATLEHIARYFVTSSDSGYLKGNEQHFEVGRLEAAECEVPFEAVFDMADMLGAYNAIPSIHAIDVDELLAIMGALVGGWPEGMRADLRVRLTGRIDRMEHRRLADGTPSLRLIDYKTGHKPGSGRFVNDLQLVCYQMGLAFGGDDESSEVAQSELFYVADNAAPAESHAPESLYQPTLFVSGHINDSVFIRRSGYKTPDRLLDVPELDAQAPEGVTPQAWREFLGLRSTQAVWAMTMIARVWYTAAARRSEVLIAHPTSEHAAHCRLSAVCPACAGRSDTIFDIREV
ncbi:MAG: PD-(D/E)XK nuclease family protein, partial [Bifidobacterium mongoliense]